MLPCIVAIDVVLAATFTKKDGVIERESKGCWQYGVSSNLAVPSHHSNTAYGTH